MAGVTEVPAGAYALLDARYGPHRPQFAPAAPEAAASDGLGARLDRLEEDVAGLRAELRSLREQLGA